MHKTRRRIRPGYFHFFGKFSVVLVICDCLLLIACSDNNNNRMETDADVIDVQAELDACESKRLSSDSEILANGWSLNNHSTRHQPPANAQLSDHDLEALELQWAFVFADDEERRGHPAVTTEAVILGSPSGMVRAMGRSTGCSIWRFAAEAEVRTGVVLGDDPGGEGRLLYFADTQAYVYALD